MAETVMGVLTGGRSSDIWAWCPAIMQLWDPADLRCLYNSFVDKPAQHHVMGKFAIGHGSSLVVYRRHEATLLRLYRQ